MLIAYNWNRILRYGHKNPKKMFEIFKYLVAKDDLPEKSNSFIKSVYYKDFSGSSFLAYPDTFLEFAYRHTYKDLCYYLALASARSLAEYTRARTLTLPLSTAKFDPRLAIKDDTLYRVEDGLIHFSYEIPAKEYREIYPHSEYRVKQLGVNHGVIIQ